MRRILSLTLALAAAGCAAPKPPPPPASLALVIQAGPDQNPDAAGHAAPVAVRLLFLASAGAFNRADALALADREAATLGPDDLGSDEVIVRPGETRNIDTAPKPGAQILGVIVLFRDIDHATWRAQAPLAASGSTKLVLNIGRLSATLAPP